MHVVLVHLQCRLASQAEQAKQGTWPGSGRGAVHAFALLIVPPGGTASQQPPTPPFPRRIPLRGCYGTQTPSIPCRTDEVTAARHVPSAVQPVLPAQPSVAALSAPSASFRLRHQTRAAPSHRGRGPAGNGVRLSPSAARQGSNRPLLVFSWLFQAPATWRGDIKASSLISKAQTPT